MHQSSLGGLFLVVPGRLNPIWYSPLLPALFFVSAIAAGMGMIVIESRLSERLLGHKADHSLLASLARPVAIDKNVEAASSGVAIQEPRTNRSTDEIRHRTAAAQPQGSQGLRPIQRTS